MAEGSGLRRLVADWGFEFFTILWSIITLIAMIVLLAFYDAQLIFDGQIITLNTIVSMLSTTSKVCLIAAISSCVSQEGWVLFSKQPRRLYDLEMVAQASRGPLGSLKLLWSSRMKGGMVVRFGALVTVLAIAIEPFSQQLVQYRQAFRESEGGSVSQALRYDKGSKTVMFMREYTVNKQGRVNLPSNITYLNVAPDFAMQGAIEFSLTSSTDAVKQQAQTNCPGSDCEFNSFRSLAVCSKCTNLNNRLRRSQNGNGTQLSFYQWDKSLARATRNGTVYELPNGLYLDNIDEDYGVGGDMVYMTAAGTTNPERTVAMSDVNTLIWSETMIKVKADPFSKKEEMWPEFDVEASECALYYCVREYSVAVRDGIVYQESAPVESVKRNPTSWKPMGNNPNENKLSDKVIQSLAYHPTDSLVERSDLQLINDSGDQWNISKEAVDGISYFMQHLFAACLDKPSGDKVDCTDATENWGITNGFYLTVNSSKGATEEYQPNSAKVLFQASDLDDTFKKIAISMSNALRAGDSDKASTGGVVLTPKTVYAVDWRWFTLPSFVELAGLIFFGLAVWSTAKTRGSVPVWKSSELAVLAHGIAAHTALKDARTPEEQQRKARDAQVVLTKSPDPGWDPPMQRS